MAFRIWRVVPQEQVPPPTPSPPPPSTSLPPTPQLDEMNEAGGGDTATTKTITKDTSLIISMLPSHVQLLASHILYFLKNNPRFDWNERFEISVQDKLAVGSNLIDLLISVCETKVGGGGKGAFADPQGFKLFLQALDQSNVPKSFIKDPECKKWLCFEDL